MPLLGGTKVEYDFQQGRFYFSFQDKVFRQNSSAAIFFRQNSSVAMSLSGLVCSKWGAGSLQSLYLGFLR